jgi:energy-coupling factor transporter ATP-binding protein EcfA2
MKVEELRLRKFTVFEDATFEFSSGLNVMIGANGTGKSHALKALYSMTEPAFTIERPGSGYGGQGNWPSRKEKLLHVFNPDDQAVSRCIRHGADDAFIGVRYDFGTRNLGLTTHAQQEDINGWPVAPFSPVIYLPANEILSIYPGFVNLYKTRQVAFDVTYYDACVALSGPLLRNVPPELEKIAADLEDAVGGKTEMHGDRFYVSLSSDWLLEAQLLAEGFRKLAVISHLIRNGSLAPGGVLFWDEPETNINPKLIPTVSRALLALAGAGIQVFIATHDYLLTNELSLGAEYRTEEAKAARLRFFALSKPGPADPVMVEWGDTVADLRENPILAEFAAHYDRENALFYRPETAQQPEADE